MWLKGYDSVFCNCWWRQMMSASHAAISKRVIPELNSGCSGTHLDFFTGVKDWCQWWGGGTGGGTFCKLWWRQWNLRSLEFFEVLFVWKWEKSFSAWYLAGFELPSMCGDWSFPRVLPQMRWRQVELKAFVLYRVCARKKYSQLASELMSLCKSCHKF